MLVAPVLALGIAAVPVAVAAVAARDGNKRPPASKHWCKRQAPFTAYYAGARFMGLPATAADVVCFRSHEGLPASGFVSYGYGDCVPDSEEGCPLPLEIQSAPLCQRHPALYQDYPGHTYPHRRLRLRGVPAASFDGGTRLELYTRRTAIIFFGEKSLLRRAAKRVHLVPAFNLPSRGHPRSAFTSEPHPQIAAKLAKPIRRILLAKRPCGYRTSEPAPWTRRAQ